MVIFLTDNFELLAFKEVANKNYSIVEEDFVEEDFAKDFTDFKNINPFENIFNYFYLL